MIEDSSAGVRRSGPGRSSSSGVRFLPDPRLVAKAVFVAADLFLGDWPGPRILIYHQVGSGSGCQMEVAPEVFVRQLDWLQGHGRITGLEEALADPDDPEARNIFVLTFDDGYENIFRNAFPVLRERRIPFTLYVATQSIETGEPLAPGDTPLDWDQVGEMVETGLVTLGSHTHRHPDLRPLSEPEVEEELATCDALIEEHTGRVPEHFAYPKGYWAPGAEEAVRRRYVTAVLGAGHPVTSFTDRHRLHRVPVQRSDGRFFFTRKLKRGMRLEERVRSRIKGYRNPPVRRKGQTATMLAGRAASIVAVRTPGLCGPA